MDKLTKLRKLLTLKLCKYIFCIGLPFFLLPLALSPAKDNRCIFAIAVVATYWLLEPVPIAATALLPVVLFPLLGVLSSQEVSICYMSETFMMFIGGLIVAVAVEHCNLHERVALKVLLILGTDVMWLMLGFMGTTMFLSMWISNTATTAMMVPIVEAVVAEISAKAESVDNGVPLPEIRRSSNVGNPGSAKNDVESPKEESDVQNKVKIALLLSICYSANIGGTGTLTGTGPNLVIKGLIEELYPESDDITFASWMMYNVPGMILCVLIAWIYLYVIFIRCSKAKSQGESRETIRNIIARRYKQLGKVSFQESVVIVLFLTLVFLWIFRRPKFISGWEDSLNSDKKVGDSVPAIAIAFLFFLLPADPTKSSGPAILDWKTAQAKLPWGVIILVGGGFALAAGAKESGLSTLIGEKLAYLQVLSPGAMVAVICLTTAIVTEVVSNTTAASIILPVINQMAVSIKVNPLFLMLPVAVTCSYAFMLPVATPPNAIAFDSGHMKSLEMMKPGIVMNIVCCCVQLFMINTLGVAMFGLNEFPDWANATLTNPANVTTTH